MVSKKIGFSRIYIISSIIFISFMIINYGGRFIYFYKQSHIKTTEGETLFLDVISQIEYSPDAYKDDDGNLFYKGNVSNNYAYYSNRYYRIIGIIDGKVVLVDDEIATILSYNGDFENSDIYNWLNKTENDNSGIYYSSLDNPEKYLDLTKTCLDEYDGTITCNDYVSSNIGLLNSYLYYKVKDEDSNFLNIDKYYWLANNINEEYKMYITSNNELKETLKDSLYGVRPVITLKTDLLFYGGSGTYLSPYIFSNEEESTSVIGSYISLNENLFRIIGADDNNYKLLAVDTFEKEFSTSSSDYNLNDKKGLAYYLNNTYYNSIKNEYMIKFKFYYGTYVDSYSNVFDSSVEAYVGLQTLGDLFMNDDTLTLNKYNKSSIYKISNGRYYADDISNLNSVKPVIYITKNIKLTGYGSKDDPLKVGEE